MFSMYEDKIHNHLVCFLGFFFFNVFQYQLSNETSGHELG